MKVSEILNKISKIRREKQNTIRSRTPVNSTQYSSRKSSPIRHRDNSPSSPCLCETSIILPKTRIELHMFMESRRYHQLIEAKADGTYAIFTCLQNLRKKVFQDIIFFTKAYSRNFEMSFNHLLNKTTNFSLREQGKCNSVGGIRTMKKDEEREIFQSPSFLKKPVSKIGFLNSTNSIETITSMHFVILKVLYRKKSCIFSLLKRNLKRCPPAYVQIIVKVLKKILVKGVWNLLCDFRYRKKWESPLRINLSKIQNKNEMIVSSADQSEVSFEQGFESSSQFTTRFQNSVEKNIKDLTLSSITSNDERPSTDRVINFTKLSTTGKYISVKPPNDFSESISYCKPKSLKLPLGDPNKIKFKPRLSRSSITNLSSSLEKLYKIMKFSYNLIIFQAFYSLKNFQPLFKPRNSQSYKIYLNNTAKSLKSLVLILSLKRKFIVFKSFLLIKSTKTLPSYKKLAVLAINNTLKRNLKDNRHKMLIFSFSLLTFINKEIRIKQRALENITKNVEKDFKFRQKVCFKAWKNSVLRVKDQFLKVLSLVQILTEVFEMRKKNIFIAMNLVQGRPKRK
ncbi:hypothetical protein SteCoe_20508 [Stentor coeruleus]|uniref:Uncharacterized protein n=1 Tax=Stentor coeruleus TaxID=5963 RepID=A0A1R2BS97_9CILI|nr:hypothetical protein SteCoe_20508 [Stentor coeruleus]